MLAELIAGVRVLRRRDSDADVPVVLVYNRGQKDVREVRVVKVKEEVQEKIQGRVEDYQIPVMLSGRGGGAALLIRAAWRRVC
jgi:hypothetical protein